MSFSIIAIFKNESTNLEEWILHYISQGVKTIYMIDNGSDDQYLPIIEKYSYKIRLFICPERYQQVKHYNYVYHHVKQEKDLPDWILVVDLDEFAYCPKFDTINEGIKLLPPDVNEVTIPEQPYGSSGFVTHPRGKIVESFVYRQPENLSCKSLFRVSSVNEGELGIHETQKEWARFNGKEIFRVNHYLIQSREYFQNIVMPRGDACYFFYHKGLDYFEKHDKLSTVLDTELSEKKRKLIKYQEQEQQHQQEQQQ
jgi:glycosyltransferase involved in cell wall biosynthesis